MNTTNVRSNPELRVATSLKECKIVQFRTDLLEKEFALCILPMQIYEPNVYLNLSCNNGHARLQIICQLNTVTTKYTSQRPYST